MKLKHSIWFVINRYRGKNQDTNTVGEFKNLKIDDFNDDNNWIYFFIFCDRFLFNYLSHQEEKQPRIRSSV